MMFILSLVKFSKNKSDDWLMGATLSGIPTTLIALGVAHGFMSEFKDGFAGSGKSVPTKTSDGLLTMNVPSHWKPRQDLHEDATLQFGNPFREEYLIVLPDLKTEFFGTLDEHAKLTSDLILSNLKGSHRNAPRKYQLNGMDAVQHEITGSVDNNKIAYLHTTVETDTAFQQVIAWTLPNRKERAFKVFSSVLDSLQSNTAKPSGSAKSVDWSKKDEVTVRAVKEVAEILNKRASQIQPKHQFIRDLGADDLDAVEIIMATEIEIADEDAEKLVTVNDLIKYFQGKLKAK